MVDISDRVAPDVLYRKVAWRILPLLVVCYVFAYIDRVNIGFAKLQMAEDVGLSEFAYGLGAGIFFLGYVLFEVPSNLLLQRIGTRKTIFRIMLLWGLTSAAMLFVHDATSFFILRFLLGVFEAGFAPGIIFYLTLWFPRARMAAAMSVLMIPGPLGSMIGGPLSSLVMTSLDGVHGMAGWQWMFLVEGLPCIALAWVVWKVLPDRPADAPWLTKPEKDQIIQDVALPAAEREHSFRRVLADPKIYALAGGYFCLISGLYAVSFWLPTILADNGVSGTLQIGLWTTVPYICALAMMFVMSRRSDRRGERRWHSAVPALVAAVALGVAAVSGHMFAVSMIALVIATATMWTSYTIFWAIPSGYLTNTAAAGGIALINSIGLLGGFFSPTLIGYVKQVTGSTEAGLLSMVVLLVLGGLLILFTKLGEDAS